MLFYRPTAYYTFHTIQHTYYLLFFSYYPTDLLPTILFILSNIPTTYFSFHTILQTYCLLYFSSYPTGLLPTILFILSYRPTAYYTFYTNQQVCYLLNSVNFPLKSHFPLYAVNISQDCRYFLVFLHAFFMCYFLYLLRLFIVECVREYQSHPDCCWETDRRRPLCCSTCQVFLISLLSL